MPKIVDKLTEAEKAIEARIRERFSEQQMCAYFLTKTIRSQYQFDDEFVSGWYQEGLLTEMEKFFAGEAGK